ncbi:MAG TPA: beta-propeller fold lactonase family protein [Solirubrobacteraceae bacterium]
MISNSRRRGLIVLLAMLTFGMLASNATAYFSSRGTGSFTGNVISLTVPASPLASAGASTVTVTWAASTISGSVAANSYTVERYTAGGTDLGSASCGPVPSSAGTPNAFGSFSCTDSPPAGRYTYKIVAHYRTWTAGTGFTPSVSLGSSSTTVSSSTNPSIAEGQVTYSATVSVEPAGTPTGDVEFLDGESPIANCTEQSLSGASPFRASCSVTYGVPGSHSITARYLGDSAYPGSTSSVLTQTVNVSGVLTALSPPSVESAPGASHILVTPDGKNVYATDRRATIISQYSRNLQTGKLQPLSPATVAAQESPESIVISPDGKYVYVANGHSDDISQYERNPSTGALAPLSPETVPAGDDPIGLAISPDGSNVYSGDADGEAVFEFSRNANTGQLSALPTASIPAGNNTHGVIVSPDGNDVYVTNYGSGTVSQYSRASGGELADLSPATVKAGVNPHDLAINPDGTSVYVADSAQSGGISQLSRSTSTGALVAMRKATVAAGEYTECVAVSPDGASVYATNFQSKSISQYSRNSSTGELTTLVPNPTVAAETEPEGITVSPDGMSVYATNFGSGTVSQYSRAP